MTDKTARNPIAAWLSVTETIGRRLISELSAYT